jgi:predicted DNA-binding antitoxin AbrB/MazE fold protein
MSKTIHAIFENGVFRPTEVVEIPENSEVEVEVRVIKEGPTPPPMSEGLAKIYAILGERYNSGHTDTAARHNEHQP